RTPRRVYSRLSHARSRVEATFARPQPTRQPAESRRFDPTQRSRNARLQPSPSEAVVAGPPAAAAPPEIRKPTPRAQRSDRKPAPRPEPTRAIFRNPTRARVHPRVSRVCV
uniref:Uncharacterized protein n=1 Tax=Cucumis melo TaxID=3656 RepID=A0A9I9E2E9_CUCME